MPLYRDEEKGNVIIERPCAKLAPSFEEQPDRSNKPLALNTQLSKSQHKLAGFVSLIYMCPEHSQNTLSNFWVFMNT